VLLSARVGFPAPLAGTIQANGRFAMDINAIWVPAALQSTGTYRMVRALINEAFGFDMEKDATIQNVDNPAAAVSLLMANRADAALSWEPNITTGLIRKPDLGNAAATRSMDAGRQSPRKRERMAA